MLLITNAEVYSPTYIGKKDILISNESIIAIKDKITSSYLKEFEVKVYDAKGKILIPGLIDAHVHIAGAGGEGGPASRTPELQLSQMITGGVTTVVGCLGTDGITRSPISVLMKAKALRAEGVSAWIYTGSYQVPTPTITGDIAKDLALIEEVIGIGEIALSDHRSSCPTIDELIRLVSQARVGGMLGGKAGIANIHMGDAKNPFLPIIQAVEKSELTYKQFLPTHCNRNDYIFEDAKIYAKKGYIDLTASSYPYFADYEVKPSKAIAELLQANIPIEHICMTSDAIGSLPDFDENGNLRRLEMGLPKSIFDELRDTVLTEKIPLEIALKVVTSTPAQILKLNKKGKIEIGKDADLVILNSDFSINSVFAKGIQLMDKNILLKKGTFE